MSENNEDRIPRSSSRMPTNWTGRSIQVTSGRDTRAKIAVYSGKPNAQVTIYLSVGKQAATPVTSAIPSKNVSINIGGVTFKCDISGSASGNAVTNFEYINGSIDARGITVRDCTQTATFTASAAPTAEEEEEMMAQADEDLPEETEATA